jgi:hypothetical protein
VTNRAAEERLNRPKCLGVVRGLRSAAQKSITRRKSLRTATLPPSHRMNIRRCPPRSFDWRGLPNGIRSRAALRRAGRALALAGGARDALSFLSSANAAAAGRRLSSLDAGFHDHGTRLLFRFTPAELAGRAFIQQYRRMPENPSHHSTMAR